MNVTIDTLSYANKLIESGVSGEQARIQAGALFETINDTVASKHDVTLLNKDIDLLRQEVKTWIESLEVRVLISMTVIIIFLLSIFKFVI